MDKIEYKLCPKCGTQSGSDAMFCIKCGYNLKNEPVKVHVENGLFYKHEITGKVLLFGNVPTQYIAVGPVLGRVSFNSRVNEDYSQHMEKLMNKIREIVDVNELDGVANISITTSSLAIDGIEKVSLIASGDGIKLR
ncbi:zinc ribbon domain-containing protein [Loigolactobacillus bifermentans]|nr:zinc ribbon domain-containing protein [Loigolactobacillus bifermentans]QGG61108.1 zinc-ribbon domain-containing protein [Loigolactobacillus bifermentans]